MYRLDDFGHLICYMMQYLIQTTLCSLSPAKTIHFLFSAHKVRDFNLSSLTEAYRLRELMLEMQQSDAVVDINPAGRAYPIWQYNPAIAITDTESQRATTYNILRSLYPSPDPPREKST